MNVNNFDFYLREVVINGLTVKDLEEKYERTDYLYCIDNGLVYDDDAHKLLGYKLETYKSLYISDLEKILDLYCEKEDIDLDDLKLHYSQEKKND
nr:hypothetical protein [uncultured Agathobacter sp.]